MLFLDSGYILCAHLHGKRNNNIISANKKASTDILFKYYFPHGHFLSLFICFRSKSTGMQPTHPISLGLLYQRKPEIYAWNSLSHKFG